MYSRRRREQHGPPTRVLRSVAKIVVVRQLRHAIYRPEARPVQHLHQASLARIQSNFPQALVRGGRLLTKHHSRLASRDAHALQQQSLARQRPQPAYRQHRIFQVIEQAEAQRQIKRPQLQYLSAFHIALLKHNSRKSSARLRNVSARPSNPLTSSPHSCNICEKNPTPQPASSAERSPRPAAAPQLRAESFRRAPESASRNAAGRTLSVGFRPCSRPDWLVYAARQ